MKIKTTKIFNYSYFKKKIIFPSATLIKIIEKQGQAFHKREALTNRHSDKRLNRQIYRQGNNCRGKKSKKKIFLFSNIFVQSFTAMYS